MTTVQLRQPARFTDSALAATLDRWVNAIRLARLRRAEYNRVLDELSSMSSRDLSDIGLVRAQIVQIAREAADAIV